MIEVHFQVSLLRSCVEFPSTPGSSAELLSVQSPVFFFPPFCPLKALCVSNPFNLSPFHLYSLLSTPDDSLRTHLSSRLGYLYTFSPQPPDSLPEPCEPATLSTLLYPGLPSTWPRADYTLDITVPDVYD